MEGSQNSSICFRRRFSEPHAMLRKRRVKKKHFLDYEIVGFSNEKSKLSRGKILSGLFSLIIHKRLFYLWFLTFRSCVCRPPSSSYELPTAGTEQRLGFLFIDLTSSSKNETNHRQRRSSRSERLHKFVDRQHLLDNFVCRSKDSREFARNYDREMANTHDARK